MTRLPQAAIDAANAWAATHHMGHRDITACNATPLEAFAAGMAAERERIRQLAIRTGAACTGSEGTSHYFADLLTDPEGTTP